MNWTENANWRFKRWKKRLNHSLVKINEDKEDVAVVRPFDPTFHLQYVRW